MLILIAILMIIFIAVIFSALRLGKEEDQLMEKLFEEKIKTDKNKE